MQILLDTNIIIPLEDSARVLNDSLANLFRISTQHGHRLIVHPASYRDIERDRNLQRREISLSRITKYTTLDPPLPREGELASLGLCERDDNDRADNEMLYALYRSAANILVSEDRQLHKKAALLGIQGRVHYIQQATSFLESLHTRVGVALPSIEEVELHRIDLTHTFFDSLRQGYDGFDDWYKDKARLGRTAWVYWDDSGNPGAVLIFKEEQDAIITDDNRALRGKVLKLCTFKVAEHVRGRKLGELLLKAAFRYGSSNGIESIYITMTAGKHDYLEDLCKDFGFTPFGSYKGDSVFVKAHPISPPNVILPPLEYHTRYYPHFLCGEKVSKYLVPIQPEFHAMLFPDAQVQSMLFVASTAGHAIKQAYLCHANIGTIRSGDVLFFYRSKDVQAITSVGIVELVEEHAEQDKILQLVSKRTVYSYEEIASMAGRKTKVILFRLAVHLPIAIPYSWLKDQGVVNGPIQTIRGITHDSFKKIFRKWGISNCLLTS
ncbi:GNAT family N-acetyltransferase [Nitrospira sp. Nam74]